MRNFRPSEDEIGILKSSASQLRKANALFGVAKRESEAAKKVITDWLRDKRQLDLAQEQIGEVICIEDVMLIEVTKQNRLDKDTLMIKEPETYGRFLRDFPMLKFRALNP